MGIHLPSEGLRPRGELLRESWRRFSRMAPSSAENIQNLIEIYIFIQAKY